MPISEKFTSRPGLQNVLLDVRSSDHLCPVLSVQSFDCPVDDVNELGRRQEHDQTMASMTSLNVFVRLCPLYLCLDRRASLGQRIPQDQFHSPALFSQADRSGLFDPHPQQLSQTISTANRSMDILSVRSFLVHRHLHHHWILPGDFLHRLCHPV